MGSAAPPHHLIFLDPPYRQDLAKKTVELITEKLDEWLAPQGLIAAQAAKHESLPQKFGGLEQYRCEPYGVTQIAFYRRCD